MDPFDAATTAFRTPTMQAAEEAFVQNVRSHFGKFLDLWHQFGLEERCVSSRSDELWQHAKLLLDQMYDEDYASYLKVQKRIKAHTAAVDGLAKLLQVDVPSPSGPLFKRDKFLRDELDRLTTLKRERLESHSRLRGEESEHKAAMGLLSDDETGRGSKVPSEDDIRQLSERVAALGRERERRRALVERGREELSAAARRGEWLPEIAFERNLLQDGVDLPLSKQAVEMVEASLDRARSQVKALEARRKSLADRLGRLWRTLDIEESDRAVFPEDCRPRTVQSMESEVARLEDIRSLRVGTLVEGLRLELELLWDECHVSESERRKFRAHSYSEIDGSTLELHEDEVEKWRKYSDDVKPILDKVGRRQRLWEQMQALETNATNPDRFKNRGGNLLAEEKERKRIQKELPSLENEIFGDIEEFESLGGMPFLYYGEDYRNFVSEQWVQRMNQKEFQKVERRKQRSLESTATSTPSRRQSMTPGATPKKVAKPSLTPRKGAKSSSGSSAGCTPLGSRAHNRRGDLPIVGRLFELRSPGKEDRAPAESLNGTTYTEFVGGLDQSNFHSSVLNNSKMSKKGKGAKGKKVGILRKSVRNAMKAAAKFTPKRGKSGLPFLI